MRSQMRDSDSSDSDAPEALNFNASKGDALAREKVVRDFHAIAAKKRRELNNARENSRKAAASERRRKEPTASSAGLRLGEKKPSSSRKSASEPSYSKPAMNSGDSGTLDDPEDLRAHRRMEAAMRDAGEESDELDESLGDSVLSLQEENSDLGADEDEDSRSTLSHNSKTATTPATSVNHLPDSVFAAAKAASDALQTKVRQRRERMKRRAGKSILKTKHTKKAGGESKSKASSTASSKDVVIGTRIVRPLAPLLHKRPGLPAENRKDFLKESRLGKKVRYQRRASNLTTPRGTLGPPIGFTRR